MYKLLRFIGFALFFVVFCCLFVVFMLLALFRDMLSPANEKIIRREDFAKLFKPLQKGV